MLFTGLSLLGLIFILMLWYYHISVRVKENKVFSLSSRAQFRLGLRLLLLSFSTRNYEYSQWVACRMWRVMECDRCLMVAARGAY